MIDDPRNEWSSNDLGNSHESEALPSDHVFTRADIEAF
jgi:hypothetical protein